MSYAALAIKGLGHDAGCTGLSDTPGTGKKKGVGDTSRIDRILQSSAYMFLAYKFRESLGAVFPCQAIIARTVGQEY